MPMIISFNATNAYYVVCGNIYFECNTEGRLQTGDSSVSVDVIVLIAHKC